MRRPAIALGWIVFLGACRDAGSPPQEVLAASESILLVGAAAVPITPENPTGVVLAGFGGFVTGGFLFPSAMRYAEGVHDDIWARSIAITEPSTDTTLLFQSVDLVGMQSLDINPVKRRIERELGIPFENVAVSATHNHMGPDVFGIWAGELDYAYQAWLRERMFESAKKAFEARSAARMKSATTEPPSGYDPETLVMKTAPSVTLPDTWDKVREFLPGYDIEVLQTDLRDPYVRNTKVVAMLFEDVATGQTIATVVNWHDHPEVLESDWLQISSDFPHYLRERVEATVGGVCLYFSGSVGCQIGALEETLIPERDPAGNPVFEPGVFDGDGNPFPKFAKGKIERIRSLGFLVADTAIEGLEGAPWTESPGLSMKTEPLDIDFTNPALQAFLVWLSNRPDKDSEDQVVFGPHITSPVGGARTYLSVIRVGECQIVTVPGELAPEYMVGRPASSADYGLFGDWDFPPMISIETFMTGRDKMIFGLTNDYFGYAIPKSDHVGFWAFYHPNHYEEFVSPGPDFGDSLGNKLLQMLGSQERFSNYPINP